MYYVCMYVYGPLTAAAVCGKTHLAPNPRTIFLLAWKLTHTHIFSEEVVGIVDMSTKPCEISAHQSKLFCVCLCVKYVRAHILTLAFA